MQKLKQYFSYKKFQNDRFKILYLNDNYFLQNASIKALKNLGHEVLPLKLVKDPTKMLEALLKTCVIFKPDCIMGINHGGYDPEGKIAEIVDSLGIPVIFWYLDDFRFIIFNGKHHAKSNTAIFTFEKKHVPLLRKLGFEHVFYLPSAASVDPHNIKTIKKFDFLDNKVTFVGNTFDETKLLRQKEKYHNFLSVLEDKMDFTKLHHHLVNDIEKELAEQFIDKDEFYHFSGFVIAHATQKYRQHMLNNLTEIDLHIFGDTKWKKLVNGVTIHPPTSYETETPYIYKRSIININLSSQQLEDTVSLRIFDVPAAGGFLITDWKPSLTELFEIDKEIIFFRSKEELKEKIEYFTKHNTAREKIIAAASQRVEENHLIIHRMRSMLEQSSLIWG